MSYKSEEQLKRKTDLSRFNRLIKRFGDYLH